MRVRIIGCGLVYAAVLVTVMLAWPEPAYTHKPITTNILFKNEIAQIFQRKCFQCHSDNNLSMPLTTYTEARPWARAIREEVLDRTMPPWQAVAGYGRFANDLSLNMREKEIILSWADGGAPSGVLKAEESIPPVYVPTEPAWDHGTPDHVVPVGKGQTIAAGAPFTIKRVVVTTNLPGAKRLHAIALKQGDRRVVRHAAFFEEATGRWLGAWTPWQTASLLAGNIAVSLPAKARLVVEIGYAGTEQDVTDTSEIGLYFASAEARLAAALTIAAPETSLAAGATDQRVRATRALMADTQVVALWPDPSAGAKSIEITATSPEGVMTPLLWIQDYRAEWRSPFMFAAPVSLVRGTRLTMTTYFDNPADTATQVRAQAWLLVTTAGAR